MQLNGLMLSYATKLLLGDPLTRSLHAETQRRMAQAVPLMGTHRQLAAVLEQIRGDVFRAMGSREQLRRFESVLEELLTPGEKLALEAAMRDEFFRQVA